MSVPYTYLQTAAELEALVTDLLQKPEMTLALDTETTGLDPLEHRSRILLCQIGTEDGRVFVINAAKVALEPLAAVLATKRVTVLQNAKFDQRWLWAKHKLRVPHLFDTMLAEMLLNAGQIEHQQARRAAASLKSMAKRYLNVVLDKGVRKEFIGYTGDEFSAEQLQYAADDVPLLFEIKDIQGQYLRAGGLIDVAKLEFATVFPVARMELNGLGVDRAAYEATVRESRFNLASEDERLRTYLRKNDVCMNLFDEVDINLGSTKQLLEAFLLLGCPLEATDEKSLKRCSHPFARLLIDYREWDTQVTMFGEPVLKAIHPFDGRIHAEFDQLGTDSGRFACYRPNLQQIPADKRFRSNFVAQAGNQMVVGDWSQFELRILCFFSGDRNMLEAFEADRDLHSDTAARMYGIPYEEVTKDHPARKDAKILNFALAYGMGPRSLADSLKCEEDEAKAKMERYFSAYPGVKQYLDGAARQGVRDLEVRSVSGRRRVFKRPEEGDERRKQISSIERKSKNTPIQASNADALKLAMVRVQRHLDERGIAPGLVACVHDEIVLEVPAAAAEWARAMLEGEMKAAGSHYLPGVPIKADVGIANCWQK